MCAALALSPTDKLSGAKAFARSLNILLKHVRLYGLNHKRSTEQFEQAWTLLQSILTGDTGFLLGITNSQLLLDGIPLEAGPAEQSFAKMLAAAGISSIHFAHSITANDLQLLVTTFADSRSSDLLPKLQAAASESPTQGFRVNEVRFVAHDGAGEPVTVASAIVANTISNLGPEVTDWLKDPKKLLQLISAAEGTHGGPDSGTGISEGSGSGDGTGKGTGDLELVPTYEQRAMPLHENEVVNVIRFLSRMGALKNDDTTLPDSAALHQELTQLDTTSHDLLYQVLFHSAANSFNGEMPDLVKLAEHLAIRFAVESFERGEVKVNAIQQMIERLNTELGTLRKVLNAQEDRMTRAGLVVESQSEILDRQFWAAVPDWGKKNMLLSDDCWCIPSRNVRNYIDHLMERRDHQVAGAILLNYLNAVENKEAEARRKSAGGIADLADLYGRIDPQLLQQAILKVGRQLASEATLDLQTQLSAAFVRLNQEASAKRDYVALEQSLCSLARVEKDLPNIARDIRPRVSVQSRLREFVAEVHQCTSLPEGLVDVLRRTPGAAAEEIASQFARCSTKPEAERYVELTHQVGDSAIEHLKNLLLSRSASEGIIGVGLLARFDMELLLNELPYRVRGWSRQQQDSAVRQIAASNADLRGELLLALLDQLDTLIVPEAIDEIGLAGNPAPALPLLDLAEGKHAAEGSPYVQLKSVEAIGRLRIAGAEDMLIELVSRKSLMGFSHPRELRVAAMQALQRINPDRARHLMLKAGLDDHDLNIRPLDPGETDWIRQRRYQRVVPGSTITATAVTAKGRTSVALERISLGGGLAVRSGRGQFGTEAILEMQTGLRHLRSRVLIREAQAGVTFEIADIGLEERGRLRKLIAAQMR
jgi:hypothetical protein